MAPKTITINVYDAGPAVFDFSNANANGERDPHVIRDQHREVARLLSNELSTGDRKVTINIVFPTDKPFIPTDEELSNMAQFSSRIANSCQNDITRSQVVVGNVSPWPKQLPDGKESVMADEGTVMELGFAMGLSDVSRNIIQLAEDDTLTRTFLPKLLMGIGLPKVVVPYNTSHQSLAGRMKDYYNGETYQSGGLEFSKADHTMFEDFGNKIADKNNAMISNIARQQGFEPQTSFENALRVGVEKYLEMETQFRSSSKGQAAVG